MKHCLHVYETLSFMKPETRLRTSPSPGNTRTANAVQRVRNPISAFMKPYPSVYETLSFRNPKHVRAGHEQHPHLVTRT